MAQYHFGDVTPDGFMATPPRTDFSTEDYFNIEDYDAILNNMMFLRFMADTASPTSIRYPKTDFCPNGYSLPSNGSTVYFYERSYPLSYAIQQMSAVILNREPDKAINMFTADALNTHNQLIYEMWLELGGESIDAEDTAILGEAILGKMVLGKS